MQEGLVVIANGGNDDAEVVDFNFAFFIKFESFINGETGAKGKSFIRDYDIGFVIQETDELPDTFFRPTLCCF